MRTTFAAIGVACALGLAGCASGSSATNADAVNETAPPSPSVELAPAESDALITVVGGDGATISFDELETLPVHEIEVFEPFVEADTTFQGPKLVDVFAALALESGSVEVLALNDYGYTAGTDEWPADALLATREDGEPIAVEDGGPFRVVFPDGSPWAVELETWVWSIDRFVLG
ncbi:MAG: molybdopterin-dependent oxidoreductase [Actinomycetota bacterium]